MGIRQTPSLLIYSFLLFWLLTVLSVTLEFLGQYRRWHFVCCVVHPHTKLCKPKQKSIHNSGDRTEGNMKGITAALSPPTAERLCSFLAMARTEAAAHHTCKPDELFKRNTSYICFVNLAICSSQLVFFPGTWRVFACHRYNAFQYCHQTRIPVLPSQHASLSAEA